MNQIIQKESIESLIYEIRGKQVMLDSDLAWLYQCSNGTKTINQAVKRHIKRFPERFMFRITENEYNFLRSQIGTSKIESRGGRTYLPYVFTEQGVAMLSSVLRTPVAEEISVKIMDAFVIMRKYISTNLIEQKHYKNMILRHDSEIKLLQESFQSFKEKNNHLFFNGQIYDAYSLLIDIFNKSKSEIIIIDNYIDKCLLDVLSKTKKKITIVTNKYNNQDYEKYKLQYNTTKLIINNKFHDRFIIIDNSILYHCGASFKDLGKKCFAITKLEDEEYLNKIVKTINIK